MYLVPKKRAGAAAIVAAGVLTSALALAPSALARPASHALPAPASEGNTPAPDPATEGHVPAADPATEGNNVSSCWADFGLGTAVFTSSDAIACPPA